MEKFKYIKDGKEITLTREDLGLSEFEALTLFNYLNDTLNKTPYDWWVRFSVYLALVKEFANRSRIELDKLNGNPKEYAKCFNGMLFMKYCDPKTPEELKEQETKRLKMYTDKLHVHQNIANAIKRLQLQPDKLTAFDDYNWNEIAKIWNSKNIEF